MSFRFQMNVRQLMWGVWAAAFLAALSRTPQAALLLVAVGEIVLLFWLLREPSRRLWAGVAALAFYPWMLLSLGYITWLAAWLALGHAPRPYIDDPTRIGRLVDVFLLLCLVLSVGFPVFGAVPMFMLISGLIHRQSTEERLPASQLGMLLWLTVFTWTTAIVLFSVDPGRVFLWFMN